MILLWLTLAAVAIFVLALVAYLLAIIYYLRKADGHLREVVRNLQQTEQNVALLPDQLPKVNSALTVLRANLLGAKSHLEPIDQIVSKQPVPPDQEGRT
jgi:hypothetical protein